MRVKKHKYANSGTMDPELLNDLLMEDLWLLHFKGILNSETINDLSFWSQVAPQKIIELMNSHDAKVHTRRAAKAAEGNPVMEAEVVKNEQPL